jgi:hypothetical protein
VNTAPSSRPERHFLASLFPVVVDLNRSVTWRSAGLADRDETPVCEGGVVQKPVEIRRLARTELSRVVEIDRTERIDLIYEQRGTELVERRGTGARSRGYELMAQPLPELFELEPEDVHMKKVLCATPPALRSRRRVGAALIGPRTARAAHRTSAPRVGDVTTATAPERHARRA